MNREVDISYWSSTATHSSSSYSLQYYPDGGATLKIETYIRVSGLSVRCVKE